MTAAIYFDPDAYSIEGPQLMGRNAAGHQLLRGLLQHGSSQALWALVHTPGHAEALATAVQAIRPGAALQCLSPAQLEHLSVPGVLYFPGPNLGQLAWQRSVVGHGGYSLCGVTHTTCTAAVMQGLAQLLTAPVQPWDAVICTSHAVKDQVTRVLQAEAEHLQQRLGISRLVLPQLPVIPLGVPCQDFDFSAEQRAHARSALGVDDDTVVVLYAGRLSFHAKAHPLAMYQALQAAAQASGRRVLLVECGWFAHPTVEAAFDHAARQACPDVQVRRLDGRDAARRLTAWSGADVFCSLTDNIQESFGITPLEAMAAGLPAVVSDWDGYRDTVRDGIDGWRVPTTMPEPGLGLDLAQRYGLGLDSYDTHCAMTSTLVAVDVQAATQALASLFSSADLRQQMGQAGRARARQRYDWRAVIGQYEALWSELNARRRADAPAHAPSGGTPRPSAWPAQPDPFHAFQRYPSQALTATSLLTLVDADAGRAGQRLQRLRELALVEHARRLMPEADELAAVLRAAEGGPHTVSALLVDIRPKRRPFVQRALTWLLKLGILRLATGVAPGLPADVAR